ncbi:MAG: hypothetical protein JO337_03295 [Acidimicrobiales bacterium]|nr:hypothetical protein [Acidimicrobiales bacterium]
MKVPNVDFEKVAADLNQALKEAAYIAVGLGVLGFQRAQVQRVELMGLARAVDEALAPVRRQMDEGFDRLEGALPDPASHLIHSVRAAASSQTQAFRRATGL